MQVKVIFGKPFELPQPEAGQNEKDILEMGITEIMCRIAALLPEERRGFYRDHHDCRYYWLNKQQLLMKRNNNDPYTRRNQDSPYTHSELCAYCN
jgi:hypothetical protein